MPVFRGEMSMTEQANLSAAVFSHMLENQARHGVGMTPTSISIDPKAFFQQAMSIARKITL